MPYNKIINICKTIEQLLTTDRVMAKVYIFGGFVRDTIHKYFVNPTIVVDNENINMFNDIDIWVFFVPTYDCKLCLSPNKWNKIIVSMVNHMEMFNVQFMEKSYSERLGFVKNNVINYPCVKLMIDGIKFDLCTNLYSYDTFKTMSDFTVNNLYIDLDGNIYSRSGSPNNVQIALNHIFLSKIESNICVADWATHIKVWNNYSYDIPNEFVMQHMGYRFQKLISRGFVYN